jgi:EmrB/QacA subfamily drug resistance transporter
VLAVLVAAVLVAIMPGDMVVALLPLVADDLGASGAEIGWVITGYLLVMAVGVPLYGRIADVVDLRHVFSIALGIFVAGSLVCALAPNLAFLVLGRLVQGAGAAAIPVVSVVAATRILPPGQRGGGVGLIAGSGGVGTAIGPIAGGAIGQTFGWHGLFWGAALAALALIPAVWSTLPAGVPRIEATDDYGPRRPPDGGFDLAGGVLLGLTIGLFLFSMTRAQATGFTSFFSLAGIVAAALAAVLFAWRTAIAAEPFVPPSLFSNRRYVTAMLIAFLSMLAYVAALVVIPLLVVDVHGLAIAEAGMVLTPSGVAVAALAPVAGRLSDRLGTRPIALAGLATMAMATLFISTVAAGSSPLLLSLGFMAAGIGFAFTIAPAKVAATGALPADRMGVGLGILEGAFFLGAGTGPAVIGAFLTARQEARADAVNPWYASNAAPFSDAFLAITAVVSAALIVALGLRMDTRRAPGEKADSRCPGGGQS